MSEAAQLVIVGAGGHAKVVADLFRGGGAGFELIGFVDRDPTPRRVAGLPVLGDDDLLPALRAQGVACAFVALGNNRRRLQIGAALLATGYHLPNAISARAVVAPSVTLGQGIAVMAGAVINAEARIDDFAIINSGAIVEHDCHVGLAAHVAPGCALAGDVRVGARTLLGVGASVIPGVIIGSDVVVGAGACVTRDLPAGAVAVGVPARIRHPRAV